MKPSSSTAFSPHFHPIDQFVNNFYKNGNVTENQCTKKTVDTPPINQDSDILNRISDCFDKKITIKKIISYNKERSVFKIDFSIRDIYTAFLSQQKVDSIEIIGGLIWKLLGKEYSIKILTELYDNNPNMITELFLKEFDTEIRDLDFRIIPKDEEIKKEVVDKKTFYTTQDYFILLFHELKSVFSHKFSDYTHKTAKLILSTHTKETYRNQILNIDKKLNREEEKETNTKRLFFEAYMLTKLIHNINNGINQFSMLTLTDTQKHTYDWIVINPKKFEKKFVFLRDALKISAEMKEGKLFLSLSSHTQDIEIGQIFHDKNARILRVVNPEMIEESDLFRLIYLSKDHLSIEPGIEKKIFSTAWKRICDFIESDQNKKDEEHTSLMRFKFLLNKAWTNYNKKGDSITVLVFQACHLLQQYADKTPDQKEYETLWELVIHDESNDFLSLLKSALAREKLPFDEIYAWIQFLLFCFSPSSLSSWEGKPIFRYHGLILNFEPLKTLKIIQEQVFPRFRKNTTFKSHIFKELAHQVFLETSCQINTPSSWIPYLEHLNLPFDEIKEVALDFLQDSQPTLSFLGALLCLSLPEESLDLTLFKELLYHIPKSFSVSGENFSLLYLMKKFESSINHRSTPLLDPIIKMLQKSPTKKVSALIVYWITSIAKHFPSIAYELLLEHKKTISNSSFSNLGKSIAHVLIRENNLYDTLKLINDCTLKHNEAIQFFIECSYRVLNDDESLKKVAPLLFKLSKTAVQKKKTVTLPKKQIQKLSHALYKLYGSSILSSIISNEELEVQIMLSCKHGYLSDHHQLKMIPLYFEGLVEKESLIFDKKAVSFLKSYLKLNPKKEIISALWSAFKKHSSKFNITPCVLSSYINLLESALKNELSLNIDCESFDTFYTFFSDHKNSEITVLSTYHLLKGLIPQVMNNLQLWDTLIKLKGFCSKQEGWIYSKEIDLLLLKYGIKIKQPGWTDINRILLSENALLNLEEFDSIFMELIEMKSAQSINTSINLLLNNHTLFDQKSFSTLVKYCKCIIEQSELFPRDLFQGVPNVSGFPLIGKQFHAQIFLQSKISSSDWAPLLATHLNSAIQILTRFATVATDMIELIKTGKKGIFNEKSNPPLQIFPDLLSDVDAFLNNTNKSNLKKIENWITFIKKYEIGFINLICSLAKQYGEAIKDCDAYLKLILPLIPLFSKIMITQDDFGVTKAFVNVLSMIPRDQKKNKEFQEARLLLVAYFFKNIPSEYFNDYVGFAFKKIKPVISDDTDCVKAVESLMNNRMHL